MAEFTDEQMEELRQQMCAFIPAGTVAAYAGTPKALKGRWLLCNGQAYNGNEPLYKRLYDAIGTQYGNTQGSPGWFNVPDYRGLFLRGVDHTGAEGELEPANRDPEHGSRVAHYDSADVVGGIVGSLQHFATAEPQKTGFKTTSAGKHSHRVENMFENIYNGGDDGGGSHWGGTPVARRTDDAGKHGHSVTGGDKETRPVNVYVNWIISY